MNESRTRYLISSKDLSQTQTFLTLLINDRLQKLIRFLALVGLLCPLSCFLLQKTKLLNGPQSSIVAARKEAIAGRSCKDERARSNLYENVRSFRFDSGEQQTLLIFRPNSSVRTRNRKISPRASRLIWLAAILSGVFAEKKASRSSLVIANVLGQASCARLCSFCHSVIALRTCNDRSTSFHLNHELLSFSPTETIQNG